MPSDDDLDRTGLEAVRMAAHPARLAVLAAVGSGRSLTATEAADVAGLSPSAMSYHLRAMGGAGLLEEVPGGDGRERRWRRSAGDGGPRGLFGVRTVALTRDEAREVRDGLVAALDRVLARRADGVVPADAKPVAVAFLGA